jgi:periplasmic protein TonB
MRMEAPGMADYPAMLDAVSKQAWSRLCVACTLSLLLHVTLLAGIPVNPTGGLPKVVSLITARLEPAAPVSTDGGPATMQGETAAERVALVPADPAPAAAVAGSKPASASPTAESQPESQRAIEPISSPSTGIDVPLIRDPTYYPSKQLDVYPQPLTPIRLDYPDAAASARVDGRLTVLLLIDEFGVVNDVSVAEAKPEGYFEEATVAVFRAARFSPAQKQGHPVKSRVMLQVKYLYGDSAGAMR